MINITDKTLCCGCTACMNICPKHCIEMLPDEEGFLYPKVRESECIGCNACDKVCPVLNHRTIEGKSPDSYALRSKDKDNLMKSTSGGFTLPLAEYVFSKGGKIWGAVFDKKFRVHHVCFGADGEDFRRTRGSKYVQSDLGNCFSEIKKDLKGGKIVCFIGTTCQVYGLHHFLGKEYDNLITVDLVCHGTPSPKLWQKYLDHQKNKYKSEIRRINFRNKTYGYHCGTMLIEFENGKKYTGSARVDYMLKSFFREISSRPSCYECHFKDLNRVSDFTIFDCWHITDLVPGVKDDDKGYTNLFVHSEKGRKVLDEISGRYDIYPTDTEKAIDLDGIMVRGRAKKHPRRDEFFSDIDDHDLTAHIQKYLPISKMDHIVEAGKTIINKMGIMVFFWKLKNRK